MRPTGYASRVLALFLGLALGLPPPVLALRTTGLEETQRTKQELVAQLAGLEEVTVRPAMTGDAEAIRQSLRGSPMQPEAQTQYVDQLDAQLAVPSRLTLVAIQDGVVVGGLFAVRTAPPGEPHLFPNSLETLWRTHTPEGPVVVPYLVWSSASSGKRQIAEDLVREAKRQAEEIGAWEVVTYSPLIGAKTSGNVMEYLQGVPNGPTREPAVNLHLGLGGILDPRYPPTVVTDDPNDPFGAYVHFVYQWPEGIARRMLAAEGTAERLAGQGVLVETAADETRFLLPIVATEAPMLPGALYAHASLFPNGTIYGASYTALGASQDVVRQQLSDPFKPPEAILFDRGIVGDADWRPEAVKGTPTVVADRTTLGRWLMSDDVASLVAMARRLDGTLLVVRTIALVTVDERQYLLVRTQA